LDVQSITINLNLYHPAHRDWLNFPGKSGRVSGGARPDDREWESTDRTETIGSGSTKSNIDGPLYENFWQPRPSTTSFSFLPVDGAVLAFSVRTTQEWRTYESQPTGDFTDGRSSQNLERKRNSANEEDDTTYKGYLALYCETSGTDDVSRRWNFRAVNGQILWNLPRNGGQNDSPRWTSESGNDEVFSDNHVVEAPYQESFLGGSDREGTTADPQHKYSWRLKWGHMIIYDDCH
jgi:hypothetical protein